MVGFIVAKNNHTHENDSNHIVAHHQVKLLKSYKSCSRWWRKKFPWTRLEKNMIYSRILNIEYILIKKSIFPLI